MKSFHDENLWYNEIKRIEKSRSLHVAGTAVVFKSRLTLVQIRVVQRYFRLWKEQIFGLQKNQEKRLGSLGSEESYWTWKEFYKFCYHTFLSRKGASYVILLSPDRGVLQKVQKRSTAALNSMRFADECGQKRAKVCVAREQVVLAAFPHFWMVFVSDLATLWVTLHTDPLTWNII